MNTCPNCGAEIRPGDNFCLNCGHRVAPLSPPPSAPQNDATALGGAPPYTFSGADDKTLAAPYPGAAAPSALDTIEHPAHLLVSLNNTNSTQQYLLEKTETTIGRAPNNDLALAEDKDKLISRYHATIRYENGNYILRDNGSANGTILNGQELEKKVDQPLRDGDKIAIGDYTLTYYAPASLANEHTMIGPDQSYGTVPTVAAPQEAGERVRAWQGGGGIPANTPPAPPPPPPAAPAAGSAAPSYAAEAPAPPLQPSPPPSPTQAEAKPAAPAISLQRFTQLAQPLPDFAALADATAALNGQIAALQQQLNNAQAATQGYQQELAETTNQFRAELRRVIDGINAAATAMAASRDELGIDRLKDLVQDVMHNPRDIDNARAFADRASSVNKLIQQHETALKTLQQWSARLFELTGKQE